MILTLLLLLAEPALPEFSRAAGDFANAEACRARLVQLAAEARGRGYDAVEGPYEIAPGDVRIHTVQTEGAGHRIVETRCAGAELASRSWTRHMEPEQEEFTVESVARRAPWLQQSGRQ